MNKISQSILKNEYTSQKGFNELNEYRRLAYLLIRDLTEFEFKEVFQTQKQKHVGLYEDETKFRVTFQNNKLSNPKIIYSPKPKKINTLQRFIKFIFRL